MRKLVTVREIAEIKPIEGADAIVCAVVDGWNVVTKKDEFIPGDLCVFFEIDSFLPESDFRYQFLMHHKITWNGHAGARLKTIRLRGQISQGLALPLSAFPEVAQEYNGVHRDQDFSELLNVMKWEPVIPAQLAGKIKGNFPSFLRKTDQERIQNLPKVFDDLDRKYEISLKLDGSSMTVYCHEGVIGVCSRNLDLKLEDEGNSFVRVAKESGLIDAFGENDSVCFQGELMGPGIQGNREGLEKLTFYVFDVFEPRTGNYANTEDRYSIAVQLPPSIEHVPVLAIASLRDIGCYTLDKLLDYAEGPSINNKTREGLVFKAIDDPNFSFKVISNKYLLKGGN